MDHGSRGADTRSDPAVRPAPVTPACNCPAEPPPHTGERCGEGAWWCLALQEYGPTEPPPPVGRGLSGRCCGPECSAWLPPSPVLSSTRASASSPGRNTVWPPGQWGRSWGSPSWWGTPELPKAGLRALSVLFTLFSLLLSSYLLMWLYDGQGFDPVLIAVGEAAIALKDLPADDPWELLFWGLALVTAFGVTRSEGPGDEDQVLDDAPPPDERSLALGNLEPTLREAAGSQAVRGSSAGRPNLRSEAPFADPCTSGAGSAHRR